MAQYLSQSERVLQLDSRLWFQRCGATFDQNPGRRAQAWKVGAVSIRPVYLRAENKAREEQQRPGPLVPGWQRRYHDAVVALHWKELVWWRSAGSWSVTTHSSASSLAGGASPETGQITIGKVVFEFDNPPPPKKIHNFPKKRLKQSSSKLLGLLSRRRCQAVKDLSARPTEAAQLRAPVDPHWQIASPTLSVPLEPISREPRGAANISRKIRGTVVTVLQSDTNTCHRHIHTPNLLYPGFHMSGGPPARPPSQ